MLVNTFAVNFFSRSWLADNFDLDKQQIICMTQISTHNQLELIVKYKLIKVVCHTFQMPVKRMIKLLANTVGFALKLSLEWNVTVQCICA